jgi:DNA-directed RNA polymerase specialized sigma24 family protein
VLDNYSKHWRRRRLLRRLGFVRMSDNLDASVRLGPGNPSPSAELENSEERRLRMKTVDGLAERLRVVVAMHYLDEMPLKEIAEVLQRGHGTAKSRFC